ncbi:hypothetical protein MKW98_030001 [Papaver atlanticum]|uniref:Malectin-like domain-containing protein n=1 Tax=Papaver atlanticum TaxID=357466 RepID=A0AAD4XSM7_9MAGN|nr:hypothetical protein MKW98_030001 [Papaver atlanticum]
MNTQLLNLLLLLVFIHFSCFLVLVPVSAKVFLSIDCGSSTLKPHTDKNTIVWVGDDPYIQTGETRKVNVAPPNISGWDSRVMSTLRAFPSRKKNCYSINIASSKDKDATKVERVLLRASFYYGNYDNKSSPPTFNLHFNGNNWFQTGDIITTTGIVYTEVVYSLKKGNNINVCVAKTKPDNIPFISTLEVRSLDSDAYSYVPPDFPLFFIGRYAYGTNSTTRYPEDSFDRIWASIGPEVNANYTRITSNSPSIDVSIDDKPPEVVLRTALLRANASENLMEIRVSDPKIFVQYNAYFSEVIKLNSSQKRSFNLVVNNDPDSIVGPVVPPYGRALEVRISNITSSANFSYWIDFVPTDDSTLPPLINALEWYNIGDKLAQGTNSTDVKALGLLQKNFNQLQDWNGDPCLPSPYTWDWVSCNSDTDSPRITAVNLSGLGLKGILPDFSAMDALEIIDLHNNSLMQGIPEFLGMFPKLTVLNLADNNFSGTVPSSISNNANLKFNALGNPNLSCPTSTICNKESRIPSPNNGNRSKTYAHPIVILLVMLSGLLL